jgi:outer membrane immunogenic protein
MWRIYTGAFSFCAALSRILNSKEDGHKPMIRKLLHASTITIFMMGAASAADLPRRAVPPPVFTPVPVFTWTGAYLGVNAGYITTNDSRILTTGMNNVAANNIAIGARPSLTRADSEGFTGGGQIGYNYQFTPGVGIVIGVEADAAYTDLRRTSLFVGTNGTQNFFRTSLDFLGTARGRVGYAFDRVLVYSTGGLAYGNVNDRALFFAANGGSALQFFGDRSRIETGFAVGGGIEYALPTDSFLNFFHSNAVTVKAEALYYDLGRRTVAVPNTGLGAANNPGYNSRFDNSGIIARAGINYKFDAF